MAKRPGEEMLAFDEETGQWVVDSAKVKAEADRRNRIMQSNLAMSNEMRENRERMNRLRVELKGSRQKEIIKELQELQERDRRLRAGGMTPMPWLGAKDWTRKFDQGPDPSSGATVAQKTLDDERAALEERRANAVSGGSSGSLGLEAPSPNASNIDRKIRNLPDTNRMRAAAAERRAADAQRPGYERSGMNPQPVPPQSPPESQRSMPLPLPMTEVGDPQPRQQAASTVTPQPQGSMPLPLPMTEARNTQPRPQASPGASPRAQGSMPLPLPMTEVGAPQPPSGDEPPSAVVQSPQERRLAEAQRKWEQARGGPENAWTGASPLGTEPEVEQVTGFVGPSYPSFSPQTAAGSGRPIDYSDPDLYDSMGDGRPASPQASTAGVGTPVGRRVTDLAREAMGQMTDLSNRMAQGRGGADIRDGVSGFEQAIFSGDEQAITAAGNKLDSLLNDRVFSVFEQRIARESGLTVEQLRQQGFDIRSMFLNQLRGRIEQGRAGVGYQGGGRFSGPPQSAVPTQDPRAATSPRPRSPSSPQANRPVRTKSGLAVHQFGSMQDAIANSSKGGMVESGDLVMIAGSPYTAVPGYDRDGRPEWNFKPAVAFGGNGGSSPSMAVPDPSGFNSPAEWGAALSDYQRQTMLDSLMTDPAMRASLDKDMLERVDRVRRSRQGLMSNAMSGDDRRKAATALRREEDEVLFGAMASVGASARGRVLSQSREVQIELDKQLAQQEAERIRDAEKFLYEQQVRDQMDQAGHARDLERDRSKAAEKAREDRENRLRESIEPMLVTREAAEAAQQRGIDPKPTPTATFRLQDLEGHQVEIAGQLLSEFAEFGASTTDVDARLSGRLLDAPLEDQGEVTEVVVEAGEAGGYKVPATSSNKHLPERELLAVLEAVAMMPPPPRMSDMPDQDPNVPEMLRSPDMDRQSVYDNAVKDWQTDRIKKVSEVVARMDTSAPGFARHFFGRQSFDPQAVETAFSRWHRETWTPAVKSGMDPSSASGRELIGNLHSFALLASQSGVSLKGLPNAMTLDREAFIDSVIESVNQRRAGG